MIKLYYSFTDEDLSALFDGKSGSFSEAKLKLVASTGLDLDNFQKAISSFCLYRMFYQRWFDVIFGSDRNVAVLTEMLTSTDLFDQAFSERYDWDWKTRRYVKYSDFERSFLLFRIMREALDSAFAYGVDKAKQATWNRFARFLDAAEIKIFKLPDEEGA